MTQPERRGDAPIRGIISDLDGVLYRGSRSIPESVQAFQTHRSDCRRQATALHGGRGPLAHVATRKSETIMIGDQVATDIVAGQSAGLRSLLVTTDLPFAVVAGVMPDRVISGLLDLTDDLTQ